MLQDDDYIFIPNKLVCHSLKVMKVPKLLMKYNEVKMLISHSSIIDTIGGHWYTCRNDRPLGECIGLIGH